MMTDERTIPAPQPFSGTMLPSPDIILRSSDEPQVDFHVHRLVMTLASPVFGDLFSVPQPQPQPVPKDTEGTSEEAPISVVQLSEHADVLDGVLRLIYPGTSPFPVADDAEPGLYPLEKLRLVLEVAIGKYQIESVVPLGKRLLREHLLPEGDIVGVFVVACGLRWGDVAREAAKQCLRRPIREFVHPNGGSDVSVAPKPSHSSPLLDYLPASTYHALLTYHASCSTIAFRTTQILSWLPYASVPGSECTNWNHPELCPRVGHWTFAERTMAPATRWFARCLDWISLRVKEAPLVPLDTDLQVVSELVVLAVKEIGGCESCRVDDGGFAMLVEFLGVLRRRVELEVGKVNFFTAI
ncbi:BTB domain-containing protein [Mycena chlorophos]|uniref:BTB domain-containing protein n=1 Tax=Mycena chlorophos TaxID=658473 RepID=A0A8H6SV40_MYCCL|nr:BTB domain-containing protein [Mycena chlorophos]